MSFKPILLLILSLTAFPTFSKPVNAPLPLNTAIGLHTHNGRSSFDLSPNGEWLAHTFSRGETLEAGSSGYSKTGKPFAEGDNRMQAVLTHTKTGKTINLGGNEGSSWAPVWSPNGERVAFYADDDGEAGLWIWERSTGEAQRFPGVIARPFFGFEIVRWSADSQRVLSKILPEGVSVADANAWTPATEEKKRYPEHGPNEPGVFVLSSKPGAETEKKPVAATTDSKEIADSEFSKRSMADLAIIDLKTRKVTRVAKSIKPLWYSFSPDSKYVAYSVLQGFFANSQQPAYGIELYEVATGKQRSLAKHLTMSYGIEMNWSPDSRSLAYMSSGQLAKGEFAVVSIADGTTKSLAAEGIPSFNSENGERPPLWDAQSKSLYGIGKDEKLWRVDVASGRGRVVGEIPGHIFRALITRPELPELWTTNDGRTAWALAREQKGVRSGIFSIDLTTGKSKAAVQESRSYSTTFNVDASEQAGEFAYVAKDQQHLGEGWAFNIKSNKTRQVTHLTPDLEKYEMGTARVIEYTGVGGKKLRSALLLPPGYKTGTRLPTVVWVYGGSMGSDYVNSYGFWGDTATFNMHILATRGYAVLFPDTPLERGTPMKDLLNTVTAAVDASIAQGYTDPERLAITGQSYGSYSSLSVIAQTPRFKAAIITAAVLHPDMFAAYLEMSPDGMASSIGYYEQGQGGMPGDIWQHRQVYFDNSPLFLFDKIQTPLLIGQGDQDGRLLASDAMFVGLRRLGKEVEYRIYEKEGHVITRPANVLDFWERRLDFLAEHLKVADQARARAR